MLNSYRIVPCSEESPPITQPLSSHFLLPRLIRVKFWGCALWIGRGYNVDNDSVWLIQQKNEQTFQQGTDITMETPHFSFVLDRRYSPISRFGSTVQEVFHLTYWSHCANSWKYRGYSPILHPGSGDGWGYIWSR